MTENPTVDPLLVEVWQHFKRLGDTLGQQFLQDEADSYRCFFREDTLSGHNEALGLYLDWQKGEEDDPRLISTRPGIICVSEKSGALIDEFNSAKQQVIRCVDAIKDDSELYEATCNHLSIGRLHYWKIFRSVNGWSGPCPDRLSLSLEQKVRVESVTRDECIEKLTEMDTSKAHIQIQLEHCQKLSKSYPLAFVYPSSSIRYVGNAAWLDDDKKKVAHRDKKRSSMPFYVVCPSPDTFPGRIKLPDAVKLADKSQREKRSDIRLKLEPLLPSLRVHEYA